MTACSIKTAFWVATLAVVSYAVPVTHDKDPVMFLEHLIKESIAQDTLANKTQEVTTEVKKLQIFSGLNETGLPHFSDDGDIKEQITFSDDVVINDQTPFPDNNDIKDKGPFSNDDNNGEDAGQRSVVLIRNKRGVPANLCTDAKIDTIVRIKNGNIYAFKGKYFWKVLYDGIPVGYPKRISDFWRGLPNNLDAAFTNPDGKTYFFKGSYCYRFTNKQKDSSYPKSIAEEFEGIPNDLDAAYFKSETDVIYFFKGTNYYRYDTKCSQPVESDYPKPITSWGAWLQNGIDAAFEWTKDHTYFFKDQQYSRYNEESYEIDFGYPRSTAVRWFGCQS